MLIVMLAVFYIMLGCFLDGISMVVLTMGVILPTVQAAGIDLVWFGIFIVLVVEMAQITPPVGFNLFVLQGMTGKEMLYLDRARDAADVLPDGHDHAARRPAGRGPADGRGAPGRLALFHLARHSHGARLRGLNAQKTALCLTVIDKAFHRVGR
jgi:hypothetical protein